MPLLTTSDITVRFGGVTALSHVAISAESGKITGLIGPNGAGKTTLFNVITGLQNPNMGGVHIDGTDVTRLAVYRRARLGISRTFQRLELFGSLTVAENIRAAAEIQGLWNRRTSEIDATTDDILDRLDLRHHADTPAHVLPTGLARLTELARALATQPRLLLLDEPGSGLNKGESEDFARLLGCLADDGLAILLVEHDMDLVMASCSSIHVLDFGIHIASGTPDEIRADPAVQRAYLGGDDDEGLLVSAADLEQDI